MNNRDDCYQIQLENACQLTGSNWSAWIDEWKGQWHVRVISNREIKLTPSIENTINDEHIKSLVQDSLQNRKMLSHFSVPSCSFVNASQIYIFPNQRTRQVLLVSADRLTENAISIFKLIAHTPPQTIRNEVDTKTHRGNLKDVGEARNILPRSEHVPATIAPTGISLENILIHFVSHIPCDAAYIAVRRGDSFRVQATWQCVSNIQGTEISIEDAPVLHSLVKTRAGLILNQQELAEQRRLPRSIYPDEKCWMGVPVTVGQRMIGIATFASGKRNGFSSEQLLEAVSHVSNYAYLVEHAILFGEATRYLQQLALLNELAATASAVDDIEDVSRRVMQRLRRTFDIDWAALYLLSPDKNTLREYGGKQKKKMATNLVGSNTPIDYAIQTGQPLRFNNTSGEQIIINNTILNPLSTESASELVVPLKYRGQIIGALSLISQPTNTFSAQDEQLLILIASNLAGLFENMRLNKETQDRAQKLEEALMQLQESQKALIQSEKLASAGRLMASIAHEINNPLQAVQNCLHLIGRDELDEEIRISYLGLAEDELTRLINIVHRMLDYYRPGGLDRKSVNVNEILQKTITLSQTQLADREVLVHLDLLENIPTILAVGDQIQQVFLNLILNASQALENGGHLWISTRVQHWRQKPVFIEISFRDSGPGVPENLRSQLFEPFVGSNNIGLGLGLAVSYGIIAAHEGNLELVETDKPGACFRITLPIESEI